MSWAEKELRDTFRQSLAERSGVDAAAHFGDTTEQCPPAEKIWDALALKLEPPERRDIINHTSFCATCAMVWQAALSIRDQAADVESPQSSGSQPSSAPGSWWQRLLRPAIAGPVFASVAALLVSVVWLNQTPTLEPLQAPAPSGVLRGAGDGGLQLTQHSETLEIGEILQWTAVNDADGYRVRLVAQNGRSYEQLVTEPTVVLDSSFAEQFSPGQNLVWTVEVVGGDAGGNVSAAQSFTFAPSTVMNRADQ